MVTAVPLRVPACAGRPLGKPLYGCEMPMAIQQMPILTLGFLLHFQATAAYTVHTHLPCSDSQHNADDVSKLHATGDIVISHKTHQAPSMGAEGSCQHDAT